LKGFALLPNKLLPLPKPGVSPFFNACFAYLSQMMLDERYDFAALENIPDCIKYEYPSSNIDFRIPNGLEELVVVELNLSRALETLGKDCFELSYNRWDRVKMDLSQGWCYMPWMYISEEYGPTLMDGRHRIVALMRILKIDRCPFLVEPEYVEAIKDFDNSVIPVGEYKKNWNRK